MPAAVAADPSRTDPRRRRTCEGNRQQHGSMPDDSTMTLGAGWLGLPSSVAPRTQARPGSTQCEHRDELTDTCFRELEERLSGCSIDRLLRYGVPILPCELLADPRQRVC